MNGRGRIPHWVCQRHLWWNSKDGFKQTAEERPSARQKPQPCCRDKRCQKQQLDDWTGVPHAVKQVGVCITPLNLPKSNWQLFCSRCKWSLTFILSQSDVRRAFFYFFFSSTAVKQTLYRKDSWRDCKCRKEEERSEWILMLQHEISS